MTKALLLGKFLPFHNGHKHMIQYANSKYDQCIVIVFSRNGEKWSGELRRQWIIDSLNNPHIKVLHIPMDYCDPFDEESWEVWADTLKNIGHDVTHFVSSEQYGFDVAKNCGWKHDIFDEPRLRYPVSGTNCRSDTMGFWRYLPNPVKQSLVTKIAIVGAESTGKSTLSRDLARTYNTIHAEEYGREYCLYKDITQLTERDLNAIVCEQKTREQELSVLSNGVLFCDTEVLVTRAWSKKLLGYDCVEEIGNHDFYLVTNANNPWHQDGTRVCDKETRIEFNRFIVQELKKHNKQFIELPLGFEVAKKTAINLLDTIHPTLRNFKV